MSNYTKIQNWASLADTEINGGPFDTEFAAVATASATKSNKKIPATTNNVASLSSTGDLQDTGILAADVVDAVAFHFVPGDVKLSAIDSEPTGWLYADGGSHSTSTYAALFSAIGYDYGGSGSSFNVPDLRGRAPVALDNLGGTSANRITDAAADAMAGSGGVEEHALTTAELAVHTHTGATDSDGAHTHSVYYSSRSVTGGAGDADELGGGSTSSTSSNGAHTHTLTIDDAGSGDAHTNLQPYLALNYLIKT